MGQTDSKTDKHAPLASKVRHSTRFTMKSLLSPKYRFFHSSDPARTNLYETTAPIDTVQRRQRPVVPLRTDSTRSLTRSMDTSSSSSTSIDHDNSTSNKSQSIYEFFHSTTNGHFLPLQSVREDESFEEMSEKSSKMPHDHQRLLIETVKDKYQRQFGSTMDKDSNKSTMSTGFSRQERLRSSLPFIIKPAAKSNSLGLCFLICENETKKVLLPPFISCMDTLKALFVRAFPQQLTMKQMETDHLKIYVREMEKDIFYQLEDLNDVKDRSVLKLIQVSPVVKGHVSFKEPEIDETLSTRLSRLTRLSNDDEKLSSIDSSRSLSEPRNRFISPELSPRSDDNESRIKIELMERQLEALTDLVKQLTQQKHSEKPHRINNWIKSNGKTLRDQLKDLKTKTHSLRDDLSDLRRMQHSLHETFQLELEQANRKIEEQLMHFNEQNRTSRNEENFDFYIKTSGKINRDLEDLQIAVEQLQNDVKTKQCFITIHDVECFALVLSTISRTLVDLKSSFPTLREKLFSSDQPSMIKFLHEEPERLDFTIKKCKRLTAMLYQLKKLAVTEEQRCRKPLRLTLKKSSLIDHRSLIEEIQSISINSDERIRAIEISEKLRERRLQYEHRLETLKQMKTSTENDASADNHSLTNSFSTRTSLCSTDSNHCPSPSLSYLVRRALTSTGTVKDEQKIQVSSKPTSKVTFSHQLITPNKPLNKKVKPTPPPRIQSTSSSSAVSSASSSLSSCTSGGNGHSSRLTNGFCGILPLLSPERRHHGRCYSFSSSSTDTDSAVSNLPTPPALPPTTTTTRVSVTDL